MGQIYWAELDAHPHSQQYNHYTTLHYTAAAAAAVQDQDNDATDPTATATHDLPFPFGFASDQNKGKFTSSHVLSADSNQHAAAFLPCPGEW